MADATFLEWPFFDDSHRQLARAIEDWARREISSDEPPDIDNACPALVKKFGAAGWLRYAVPKPFGGVSEELDVRSLCLIRQTLAGFSGLAEFSLAMQGLGSGPISFFGSEALKRRYLPRVAAGEAIAAFAISETEAGSDVAAMQTVTRRDGSGYVIDGQKTWI